VLEDASPCEQVMGEGVVGSPMSMSESYAASDGTATMASPPRSVSRASGQSPPESSWMSSGGGSSGQTGAGRSQPIGFQPTSTAYTPRSSPPSSSAGTSSGHEHQQQHRYTNMVQFELHIVRLAWTGLLGIQFKRFEG